MIILPSNLYNENYNNLYEKYGHIGISFEQLEFKNKKKIFGFNPSNFNCSTSKLFFSNLNKGYINNDIDIFIDNTNKILCFDILIKKNIFETYCNYSNFPECNYGIPQNDNNNNQNCLSYFIKYLEPIFLNKEKKYELLNSFDGSLSKFIENYNNYLFKIY